MSQTRLKLQCVCTRLNQNAALLILCVAYVISKLPMHAAILS